jgi:hypothetical protein
MLEKGLYMAELFVARGDAGLEDILQALHQLRAFCSLCAKAGDGAIRVMG